MCGMTDAGEVTLDDGAERKMKRLPGIPTAFHYYYDEVGAVYEYSGDFVGKLVKKGSTIHFDCAS